MNVFPLLVYVAIGAIFASLIAYFERNHLASFFQRDYVFRVGCVCLFCITWPVTALAWIIKRLFDAQNGKKHTLFKVFLLMGIAPSLFFGSCATKGSTAVQVCVEQYQSFEYCGSEVTAYGVVKLRKGVEEKKLVAGRTELGTIYLIGEAEHGFSGSPVVDMDRGCAIGLVSSKSSNSKLVKAINSTDSEF